MSYNRKTIIVVIITVLLFAVLYIRNIIYIDSDNSISSLQLESNDAIVRNEAIKQLKKLADKGNPVAQYRYAEILLRQDEKASAIHYLQMSSNAGELISIELLGLIYIESEGGENILKGFHLLNKAAEKGLSTSQLYLGMCYHDGECSIPKNDYLAFFWLSRALDNGEYSAKLFLEKMPSLKISVKRSKDETRQVICQIDTKC